ncbi:efflux RND transporter periplasmic adaptor subunit [Arthrobacter sp. 35W]|uniref:efflux RND transporter periplasmic adaptor subunit n=1 Tax=Arthrobacter sp. 35W TaxID=1132441 RepID=UPI0018C92202|nr:efflux RND transporter periplasmic adaptor subunit [Arthrobacter sp. 35W]
MAWLLVFGVIAVALVKMAFIDGLKEETGQLAPHAAVAAPQVPVVLGTVVNTVELKGTVSSDPDATAKATAAGKVVHFFVEAGEKVARGDKLLQIRSEEVPDAAPAAPAAPSAPSAGEAPAAPVYTYTNVLSPVDGTVATLPLLPNQQVGIGDAAATIATGTFTINAPLDAAAQYRLLGRPTTATGFITGGPGAFTCLDVKTGNAPSTGGTPAGGLSVPAAPAGPGAPSDGGAGGAVTGTVSCGVPSTTAVFAGLGATVTVSAGEARDVLTVPLTAVKGSVTEGTVWVPAASGEAEQRKVTLGLNDGAKVEVVQGLAAGESVLEFVPGAPAPEQPGMSGGMVRMGG